MKHNLRPIIEKGIEARLLISKSIDENFMRRARKAHTRNITEPGDCNDFPELLKCLAVAEAYIGIRAGWIPEVQKLGCELEKLTFNKDSW